MNTKPGRIRTKEEIKKQVIEHLQSIFDPEIPVNIYDLGLIYEIKLDVLKNYMYCTIVMTLTSPACPVADTMVSEVNFYTKSIPEIDEVDIKIIFDPIWNPSKISKEGREILELEGTIIPLY